MKKILVSSLLALACSENRPTHSWSTMHGSRSDTLIVYLHIEDGVGCEDLVAQLLTIQEVAEHEEVLHEEWVDEEGDVWIGPVSKWHDFTLVVREVGTTGEQSRCFVKQRIDLPQDSHVFVDIY